MFMLGGATPNVANFAFQETYLDIPPREIFDLAILQFQIQHENEGLPPCLVKVIARIFVYKEAL